MNKKNIHSHIKIEKTLSWVRESDVFSLSWIDCDKYLHQCYQFFFNTRLTDLSSFTSLPSFDTSPLFSLCNDETFFSTQGTVLKSNLQQQPILTLTCITLFTNKIPKKPLNFLLFWYLYLFMKVVHRIDKSFKDPDTIADFKESSVTHSVVC